MYSNVEAAISRDLGLPLSWVHTVLLQAPFSYKVYRIPKRSGGEREIAQPSKKTKALQYWVMENILRDLPFSGSATAYVRGFGIRENASRHSSAPYLAKFDFKDFFPSIKGSDLEKLLYKNDKWGMEERDVKDVIRICFRRPRKGPNYFLSIGAPSSPMISNAVLYDFDSQMESLCSSLDVSYTRYADDITLSSFTPGLLYEFPELIRRTLKGMDGPVLYLNDKKTVFSSMKYQRRVTGLVLANDGSVSLGRARKREIKALVHQYAIAQLADEKVASLKGYLAFVRDVEPSFYNSLVAKYGPHVLRALS